MKTIISLFTRFIPRRYLQLISHFILRIVSIFYVGDKKECTVCERKFRKFLPYGRIVKRENALCPSCLSLERHRLIWLFLKTRTDFFTAELKVLHVAPEYCFIKRFKALKNLDYTTGDIESPLADVKMDIREIPFGDNTFDVVICNHTLEHVVEDLQSMKEFHRVLKPGGRMMISDLVLTKELPAHIRESVEAYVGGLAGAMMRDDYIGCIEDAGFEDVRVMGETSFSFSSLLNEPAAKAIIDEAKISEEEARETEGAVVSIKIEGRKR